MFKHKRITAAIILSLLIGLVSGRVLAPGQSTVAAPAVQAAQEASQPDIYSLWQLTNQERVKAGVAPLVLDPALNASAAAKCADMVKLNQWDHDLPDGTNPESFIKQSVGYRYQTWGENLAFGYTTSSVTVDAWMRSTLHREALLASRFDNVGFAVCSTPSYPNMVVQHFTDLP